MRQKLPRLLPTTTSPNQAYIFFLAIFPAPLLVAKNRTERRYSFARSEAACSSSIPPPELNPDPLVHPALVPISPTPPALALVLTSTPAVGGVLGASAFDAVSAAPGRRVFSQLVRVDHPTLLALSWSHPHQTTDIRACQTNNDESPWSTSVLL